VSFLRYFPLSCMATLLFVRAAAANSVILQENFNELTPRLTVTAVGSFSAVGGTNVDIVGGSALWKPVRFARIGKLCRPQWLGWVESGHAQDDRPHNFASRNHLHIEF